MSKAVKPASSSVIKLVSPAAKQVVSIDSAGSVARMRAQTAAPNTSHNVTPAV
jgi:hypothetical protein